VKRWLIGSAFVLFGLILAAGLFAAFVVAEERSFFVFHNTSDTPMRLRVTAARTTVLDDELGAGAWRFRLATIDGDGLLSIDCASAGGPVVATKGDYVTRRLPAAAIVTLPDCAHPQVADWP